MISIIKENNGLVISGKELSRFFNSDGYLNVPLNSIILVTQTKSDIVMLKSASDYVTLFQTRWDNLTIEGELVTKENVVDKFNAIANAPQGSKINAGTNIILQEEADGSITISATGELGGTVAWTDVTDKPSTFTPSAHNHPISEVTDLQGKLDAKQDTLVSGTNIKTINGQTLLGEGNIEIQGGGGGIADAPSDGKKYVRQNANWVEETTVDTSNFATKAELDGKVDDAEIADMLTKTEAASTYQPKGEYLTAIPDEYVTETELNGKGYLTEIPSEYVTDEELNAKGYKKIEYLTQSQYDELVEKEEGVMYVITDAPEVVIPDTSTFATKEEIADMATKTWVGEQGFLTSHQDISNLATKQEVTEELATKQDKGNYLTVETAQSTYQPIGDYATKAELANKVDNSTYTEDKATFALKSELTDFITASVDNLVNYYKKSETYTKGEVDGKISAITTINFEVVAELPESGEANKIYLVPNAEQGEQNVKDEYIWVDEKWEIIGSTKVDLSNYYNKGEVDSKLSAKVDLSTYTSDKETFALKSELTNLATKDELNGKVDDAEIADMLTKTEASSTYQPKGEYATTSQLATKQDTLVSGTNIKTINGQTLLGEGNITIEGGSGGDVTKQYVDEQLALKADKTSVPTVQENNIGDTNNYIYSIKYNSSNIVNGGGSPDNYDTLNKNVLSFVQLWRNSTAFNIRFNSWNDRGVSFSADGDWMATKDKAGVISGEDKQKLDSINTEEILTKTEASTTYKTKASEWYGTQSEYDLITEKDPNVTYFITEG